VQVSGSLGHLQSGWYGLGRGARPFSSTLCAYSCSLLGVEGVCEVVVEGERARSATRHGRLFDDLPHFPPQLNSSLANLSESSSNRYSYCMRLSLCPTLWANFCFPLA
jgi:hypothetical protein